MHPHSHIHPTHHHFQLMPAPYLGGRGVLEREVVCGVEVRMPYPRPGGRCIFNSTHDGKPAPLCAHTRTHTRTHVHPWCFVPDGRHAKRFLLVDTVTGAERLVVEGEDTARLDRRYTYKALDDVGGFCFENSKAVRKLGGQVPCEARACSRYVFVCHQSMFSLKWVSLRLV